MLSTKMNTLRRIILKNRLFYSYGALKTFSQSTVTGITSFQRLSYIKQRSLLVLVNSTSINHTLTAKMSSEGNIKVVSYNFVEGLKDKQDILLIDVREPSELAETGIIPGSINIPLAEVENALKNLSSEEFFNRYGRQKPSENFPLVFSCRSGKRSEAASTIAHKLGYNNISNYTGGWLDWEQKNKN